MSNSRSWAKKAVRRRPSMSASIRFMKSMSVFVSGLAAGFQVVVIRARLESGRRPKLNGPLARGRLDFFVLAVLNHRVMLQ